MRLKQVAAAFALAGAVALLAAPADAAAKKKRVVLSNGHTVFVSRDEEGRKRTRVIIQKRSYLDPGTETYPGERRENESAFLPDQHASTVLDNTVFGQNQWALPGPFDLPSRGNPWIKF
jgi:hypothetical protein